MKTLAHISSGNSELFRGIADGDIGTMLSCLGCTQKHYKKGEPVCHAGDYVDSAGLVLSGGVYIEQTDIWGNQNILSHVNAGELFAEAYACVPDKPLMVDVTASADSEILFLQINKVLHICPSGCEFHNRLARNLLAVIAGKNLSLTRKINHITPKSIRGRVLAFLSDQAAQHGTGTFDIPFDRQHLADYLCVDRSALSNELGKMREDGIIAFSRNHFSLTVPPSESM